MEYLTRIAIRSSCFEETAPKMYDKFQITLWGEKKRKKKKAEMGKIGK